MAGSDRFRKKPTSGTSSSLDFRAKQAANVLVAGLTNSCIAEVPLLGHLENFA